MADINQEARIPVYINDEQAKSALKNLTSEAEKWRKKMYEAMAGSDLKGMKEAENELKKVNNQMNSIKREAFDVNKVLQDISNASTKDLRKAMQAVNREMEGLNRNSKEYKDLMGKRNQIREEFSKINGPIKEQAGLLGNIKSLLPTLGWGAMAAGAVMAFTKIKDSTDTLSTQWEIFIGGLNQATNEFWRTLATGDWTNFIGRMREAIEVGREYAATLDDLEEKSRALRIIEADSRAKAMDLELKLRNKDIDDKKERIKYGQERIQLEKDLAEKRTKLAQEAYDNELKKTMQETKLSKEQLENVMRDFDSMDKEKAKQFLEIQKTYDSLIAQSERFKVAQSRTGITENPFAKQIQEQLNLLNAFPESIRLYAQSVKGQGETSDVQLNKTTDAWVKLKEAQNSAVENIPRVITQVNSLLAGEKGIADKAGKDMIDKVNAAMIPDKEDDSNMDWVFNQARAEAEIFAEKKRNQEEWTAFLDKKIQEQIDIKKRELEFDKEIAAAQEELKSVRIDAVGQIAGALSEMFEKGSAAQIAFLAIEKAAAIAQIIFQTGIANAKAVAASPLTFGQPWVAINTISAGASIAGIVAQTVQQASNYYDGGYTAPGSKYQPAGIVHAGEYVIPQEGVNNAQLRPLINLIEIARQNGSLARLDLRPVMMSVQSGKGYSSGGSTSQTSSGSTQFIYPGSPSRDPELTAALNNMSRAVGLLMKHGVQFPMVPFKKQLEEISDLIDQTGMGGFKK